LGLASGPPGGRRAASALNRATWTVCHMAHAGRQSGPETIPRGGTAQPCRSRGPLGPARRHPLYIGKPHNPVPRRCGDGERRDGTVRGRRDRPGLRLPPAPARSGRTRPAPPEEPGGRRRDRQSVGQGAYGGACPGAASPLFPLSRAYRRLNATASPSRRTVIVLPAPRASGSSPTVQPGRTVSPPGPPDSTRAKPSTPGARVPSAYHSSRTSGSPGAGQRHRNRTTGSPRAAPPATSSAPPPPPPPSPWSTTCSAAAPPAPPPPARSPSWPTTPSATAPP